MQIPSMGRVPTHPTDATCESDRVITDRLAEHRNGELVLDVIDDGPLDGTPVVLLHGFPQRATMWSDVSPLLNERGARTFALDQRGYSPRARPRGRRAYRVSELISDVHTLIETIGGPVHLVGHDWGAAGAWGLADRHPDDLASMTVVSVPHPQAFMSAFVRSRQALLSYYMALFQLPFLPEWLLSRRGGIGDWLLRNSGMTEDMLDTYHREIVDDGALRGALAWYRALPVSIGSVPGTVAVPTTLVWSDGDVAITRKAIELTSRYMTGDYQYEVMDGASHWLPNEQPAEIADVISRRVGLAGT
jgi:pimeloyl-ACP methyl ester carboxylesterase